MSKANRGMLQPAFLHVKEGIDGKELTRKTMGPPMYVLPVVVSPSSRTMTFQRLIRWIGSGCFEDDVLRAFPQTFPAQRRQMFSTLFDYQEVIAGQLSDFAGEAA